MVCDVKFKRQEDGAVQLEVALDSARVSLEANAVGNDLPAAVGAIREALRQAVAELLLQLAPLADNGGDHV